MVLIAGGLMLFLFPLPVLMYLHGIQGLAESVLLSLVALILCQFAFLQWNKVPFTCFSLPGKTAPWIRVVQFFVLVSLVPVAIEALVWLLANWMALSFALVVLVVLSRHLAALRTRIRDSSELLFEETFEPPIHELQLGR
jgi:hypothetical protein